MSYLYDSLNSDNAKAVTGWIERFSTCLFCSRAMSNLGELTRKMRYSIALDMPPSREADEEAVTVWRCPWRCPYCGWWAAKAHI